MLLKRETAQHLASLPYRVKAEIANLATAVVHSWCGSRLARNWPSKRAYT